MPESKLPPLIFVVGAPGSGKGTLCSRLAKNYHMFHLSVGDLLRAERESEQVGNEMLRECLDQARLLPADLVLPILNKKMEEVAKHGYVAILVDGFPRDLGQAMDFEDEIQTPSLVLFFDCPESSARQRYLSRKLPGRLNDDEALFNVRITEFQAKNPGIVEHYSSLDILIEADTSTDTEVTYECLTGILRQNGNWLEIVGDGSQM